MHKEIEQNIHKLLLDLAPFCYNNIEQSIIIAEASYIYKKMERTSSTISKSKENKICEAKMIESILEAIQASNDTEDYLENIPSDVENMTPEQILHTASKLRPTNAPYLPATYNKPFGNMDLLNNEDLSVFFGNEIEDKESKNYKIDDSKLLHAVNVFSPPGLGKHKSDSLCR